MSQRSGGVAEASASPQRPLIFQTEGLLSAGRRKGPWWVLSISLRFKGCLKQALALSFRHEFTTPKKVLYAGSGRRFSMAGPAALPSPQLTGKSETKCVVHAGERPGLA